ncbi:MAG: hypothetical protein KIS66_06805 [Fimbriimonadaceae bacterium]|nr:hypothetical protein [Fimbriimonadaceae bacterium]
MLCRIGIVVVLLSLALGAVAQRVVTGRTDHRLQRAFADLGKGLTSVGRIDFAPLDRDLLEGLRGFRVGVSYDRKSAAGVMPARIALAALEPSRKIGDSTKDRLPWADIADGRAGLAYRLGKAHGLEWFAWSQPFEAVWIQDLLSAKGGQDPTSVLIDGLAMGDEVAAECAKMLDGREDSVARLERRIVERKPEDDPAPFLRGLGRLPSHEATTVLARFFDQGGAMRQLAGEALVKPLLRPAAKAQYLELLREPRYVEEIVPHLQEWGWFDALPIVRDLVAKPPSPRAWFASLPVKRALEDRPLDPALVVSYRRLDAADGDAAMSDAQVAYEVRVVLASTDREAALFYGLQLASRPEAETSVRTRLAGFEILRGLPRPSVEDILARFLSIAKSEGERRPWADLLARLAATGEVGETAPG